MKKTALAALLLLCFMMAACAAPVDNTLPSPLTSAFPAPSLSPAKTTQPDTDSATPEAPTPEATQTAKVILIHEGDTLERDILPRLIEVFSISEEQAKSALAAAESELISDEVSGYQRMEGLIVPGSYEVRDETIKQYVNIWINYAEERYARVMNGIDSPNGLSAAERLTLASIVEAECLGDQFESQAAAAFLNRLAAGEKLRSCVTVEYALGYQRPYLLNSDLEVSSSYNTYRVRGLPPGPIGTMDDESLAAASAKAADPNIYYFYYDYVNSTMRFFSSYDEFKAEGKISSDLFNETSAVGRNDKVNKRELYGK